MAATERESKEGQSDGAGENNPGTGDDVKAYRLEYYVDGKVASPPSHDDD